MVDLRKIARSYRETKPIVQWSKLPRPLHFELGFTEKQYGKIWYIESKQSKTILEQAKKMQVSYENNPRKNFGKKIDEDRDLQNKSQGFKGEKALHSTLEEIGIDFDHHLRHFESTEHHEKGDVVFSKSGITIEVKTGRSYATALTINRDEWVALREKPDVVFALKLLEPQRGLILVKFVGWCFGKDVASFDVDDGCYCKSAPCFYREYKQLHKVTDIDAFLNGIASSGMKYLQAIT